jgi:hypothetical protein
MGLILISTGQDVGLGAGGLGKFLAGACIVFPCREPLFWLGTGGIGEFEPGSRVVALPVLSPGSPLYPGGPCGALIVGPDGESLINSATKAVMAVTRVAMAVTTAATPKNDRGRCRIKYSFDCGDPVFWLSRTRILLAVNMWIRHGEYYSFGLLRRCAAPDEGRHSHPR